MRFCLLDIYFQHLGTIQKGSINLNHHHSVSAPSTFWATQSVSSWVFNLYFRYFQCTFTTWLIFLWGFHSYLIPQGSDPVYFRFRLSHGRQSRKTVVPISMFKWFGNVSWDIIGRHCSLESWIKTSFTCCPLYSGGMAQNIDKGSMKRMFVLLELISGWHSHTSGGLLWILGLTQIRKGFYCLLINGIQSVVVQHQAL